MKRLRESLSIKADDVLNLEKRKIRLQAVSTSLMCWIHIFITTGMKTVHLTIYIYTFRVSCQTFFHMSENLCLFNATSVFVNRELANFFCTKLLDFFLTLCNIKYYTLVWLFIVKEFDKRFFKVTNWHSFYNLWVLLCKDISSWLN